MVAVLTAVLRSRQALLRSDAPLTFLACPDDQFLRSRRIDTDPR